MSFIDNFYESVAAIIIPLTLYAKFIQLLLTNGIIIMLKLLVILMTTKRETFFNYFSLIIRSHFAIKNKTIFLVVAVSKHLSNKLK